MVLDSTKLGSTKLDSAKFTPRLFRLRIPAVLANLPRQIIAYRPWRRTWLWGLTVIGLGSWWGLVYGNAVERNWFPRNWGVVLEGKLYRSGQLSAALVEQQLLDHEIEVVIDLTSHNVHCPDQQAEREVTAELGIDWCRFPLRGDGTGSIEHYAAAITTLHRALAAEEPVLIHCSAGAQRTGGVLAAYRLLVWHDSPAEIEAEMATYGWKPQRDRPLLAFLNQHMGELAEKLVARGVLPAVPNPLPVFDVEPVPQLAAGLKQKHHE